MNGSKMETMKQAFAGLEAVEEAIRLLLEIDQERKDAVEEATRLRSALKLAGKTVEWYETKKHIQEDLVKAATEGHMHPICKDTHQCKLCSVIAAWHRLEQS